jgi:superkiller protein 3
MPYRVRKSFNITLAQALVHLYPPKHHPRALPLLENVLSQDPDNVSCLMARGYVLQFAEKWDAAESIYSHVIKIVGDTDTNVLLDAREQQAWSQIRKGDKDEGVKNLRSLIQLLDVEEGREEQKARAWWRLGQSIQQPSGKFRVSCWM